MALSSISPPGESMQHFERGNVEVAMSKAEPERTVWRCLQRIASP